MGAQALQLDPTLRSVESRDFEGGLRRKIVGQDEAVQAVVDLYQVFRAGLNSPGRPVGNLLVPRADGRGKDARRGSHGRSVVRRSARGDQGGLRGVSALARDREADRFASGISGAPRDASADHSGGARAISHRQIEDQLLAVRRNRKGVGRAVATAAGHSRQGDAHARRQPPRGFVADHDFHDVEPGRRRNHRADDRRDGFCSAATARNAGGAGRKGGANRLGSRQAEIRAGIHEPD